MSPLYLEKKNSETKKSTYLDRLISVDEANYLFSMTLYVYLSWTDPRAFAAVANATARMNEKSAVGDGGDGCDRLCIGTEMRHEASECCDSPLFLPSIVFRNIAEYPNGRPQPYRIKARENGVVTWRVEVRENVSFFFVFFIFSFSLSSSTTLSSLILSSIFSSSQPLFPDARRGLHVDALCWIPL